MKKIKLNVKTKSKNYPIIIGSDIIKNFSCQINKGEINSRKTGECERRRSFPRPCLFRKELS